MPQQHQTFADLKQQERKTRQRVIVEAAERVYGKMPFEQVNMRAIAKEAAISVSSIYRYFPDRQSLFVEAFILGTRQIIARVEDHIAGGEISGLKDFARMYMDFLLEHDHYFRMMTHFMLDGRLAGRPLEKLNQAARTVLDQFDRVFAQTGANGGNRLYSHAFFAALNGILISFGKYPGRDPGDVRRHMRKLADIVAEMLETPGCTDATT
jgi:AcrR family transcriptional regulator